MPSRCLDRRVGPELTPLIMNNLIAFLEGVVDPMDYSSDAGLPALTPTHQPESLSAILSTYCVQRQTVRCATCQAATILTSVVMPQPSDDLPEDMQQKSHSSGPFGLGGRQCGNQEKAA